MDTNACIHVNINKLKIYITKLLLINLNTVTGTCHNIKSAWNVYWYEYRRKIKIPSHKHSLRLVFYKKALKIIDICYHRALSHNNNSNFIISRDL